MLLVLDLLRSVTATISSRMNRIRRWDARGVPAGTGSLTGVLVATVRDSKVKTLAPGSFAGSSHRQHQPRRATRTRFSRPRDYPAGDTGAHLAK